MLDLVLSIQRRHAMGYYVFSSNSLVDFDLDYCSLFFIISIWNTLARVGMSANNGLIKCGIFKGKIWTVSKGTQTTWLLSRFLYIIYICILVCVISILTKEEHAESLGWVERWYVWLFVYYASVCVCVCKCAIGQCWSSGFCNNCSSTISKYL